MTIRCLFMNPGENVMNWISSLRFPSILVVAIVMAVSVQSPARAFSAESIIEDADMSSHDYVSDKQQYMGASMVQMSDDELSGVVASGYSSFTLEGDVARAYFNIETRTFTEIESLKMGYYDDGATLDWDQNWENVSLGTATDDLIFDGLFIEASFSNITDADNRTLDSIKVGTPSLTGTVSADFISFSGRIQNPTDGIIVEGHRLTTLGTCTINSDGGEFFMQLSRTGDEAGWWFQWNNATIE